ncbi:MAG TPA: outer membrane lipoprotein-sorting protein, partial [Candidatus Omnitrophota bacterium]|nr:outer membrane lipoprotein-sorting protein [Candidatus Omnitrophota bacterium]
EITITVLDAQEILPPNQEDVTITVVDAPYLSLTPSDGSTFLAGSKLNIQAAASDFNHPPLEYQFSIGGSVTQPWSSLSTHTWQTSGADTGVVEIIAEARDSQKETAAKTLTYRIINPTTEEILQKVADNYAKIYDFKADMTLSSTLNGKPFGETDYCRYYFKAPNKEKTESFTDASRTNKAEAIIIDGPTMHLVDYINKLTQQVDLLNETGITNQQFNQMDLYYNQVNFLNNHSLAKNVKESDLNNFIICLEAIPKEQNKLYSKLDLYIDYNKGLLLTSQLFKENENKQAELVQTIEALETQQMPNGAWVLTQITKIPTLKSDLLIEIADYSNIQINTGLTDSDFNPKEQ